jgi:hypothetical protein
MCIRVSECLRREYLRMNGPYETELEAIKAARIWETQGQTMPSASLTMLIEACSAAGVTRGAYDTLTLEWLAGHDQPQRCAVVAGLIERAYEAGKAGG